LQVTYLECVTKRARVVTYGSIVGVIVIAGLCRLLFDGFGVEVAALTVISLCLGAVVLLVFYEVGLSEDKARAEEEAERARRRSGPPHGDPPSSLRQRRPD
jgi:hypothetical protein